MHIGCEGVGLMGETCRRGRRPREVRVQLMLLWALASVWAWLRWKYREGGECEGVGGRGARGGCCRRRRAGVRVTIKSIEGESCR